MNNRPKAVVAWSSGNDSVWALCSCSPGQRRGRKGGGETPRLVLGHGDAEAESTDMAADALGRIAQAEGRAAIASRQVA